MDPQSEPMKLENLLEMLDYVTYQHIFRSPVLVCDFGNHSQTPTKVSLYDYNLNQKYHAIIDAQSY